MSKGVPPFHCSFSPILFLCPPPGIMSTPVMATFNLPNRTLGITFWYLDPPAPTPPFVPTPYLALTPVPPIATTPIATPTPTQAQPNPSQAGKRVDKGVKPKKRGGTNSINQAMANLSTAPKAPPPCSLCDLPGHATNNDIS